MVMGGNVHSLKAEIKDNGTFGFGGTVRGQAKIVCQEEGWATVGHGDVDLLEAETQGSAKIEFRGSARKAKLSALGESTILLSHADELSQIRDEEAQIIVLDRQD